MKLLHIADLHLGKRVGGLSMAHEQAQIIDQLISIAQREDVDALLIAGDVFDRPVPSREALALAERLFCAFCDAGIEVFAIPGNHDSPQQLAFCSALLNESGLHLARAFDGNIERAMLEKGDERVCIHMLPFVRPSDVRMALPDTADSISSHDDAVKAALATDELADDCINVLIAHQFVGSSSCTPETCDSEVLSVGGSDMIDVSAFDAYDYVALGHLHGPQQVSRETIRYAGSPLKYSFSEVSHTKGATLVELKEGSFHIEQIPLFPKHDMREITASYKELLEGIDTGDKLDYMRVILTDRSLPEAMAKLRVLYPNILRLEWEHYKENPTTEGVKIERVEQASTLDLFEEFYEMQTGEELTSEEKAVLEDLLEEVDR